MANPGWNNKKPVQVPLKEISQKARVKISPAEFDNLIKTQGVRVRVYRTVFCPNVKSLDGAEHEINCLVCKASGFIDVHPIETWAFIQSQTLEKAGQAEGMIDQCSAQATFLRGISLQYFALVEIPDFQDTFFERIKRQSGPADVLKYKALQVNVVLSQDGREYSAGNDFNLDVEGNVKWLPDRGPAPGTIYSIHYAITLQFRAIRAMHVNRFAQAASGSLSTMTKMPEQWGLEKVYLADRKDHRGNRLSPNLIRDPDSSDT